MFKNTAAKFIVFAFDATTNVPKTGDAANLTAYVSKDYGAVTVLGDTTATEMDATNAPGYYLFDAAQAETNGDILLVTGKSSTANIKVIGAPAAIYTRPQTGWLAPATAGRTLNVDASGRALSDLDTIKTNPVVNAGTVTFPTTATLASTTNITAGTITTATNVTTVNGLAAAVITAASIAADAITDAKVAADVTIASVTGSVGSVVGLTAANLDVAISTRMATYTQPTGFLATTFPAGTVASTTNITAGTITTATNLTNLPTIPANWLTAAGMDATAGEEIADVILGRNVSGGSNVGRTVKQALHFIRNKWVVSAGTLTVYDTDDTTSSWTSSVTGTAGADPVTGSDPA